MNYDEKLPGEAITLQCRKESDEIVDRQKRYKQILGIMYEDKAKTYTAKEMADVMCNRHLIPTNERNFTQPRLNELAKMGRVDTVGKRVCQWTGRNVTVYRLREQS